ncbi:MAG TPA: site-2 protease family protein [Acidimicrobiia bacterium]|nr:site-2 protease family protein [Acidimicrobiia bacterium]
MIHDNALIDALLFIAILIPSVILHEVAHGYVAYRLGDPTARDRGRLTLNPVKHIDPFGSILLPAMLALARQNVFGWAKPVPVQPHHFDRPVGGMAITALAGPATNLLIAFAVGRFGPFIEVEGQVFRTADGLLTDVLIGVLVVNAALAVFNMLPIPPLDGSRLVPLVLGPEGRRIFAQISQYGFIILIVLLFVFEDSLSFLGDVIGWVVRVAI